MKAIVVMSCCIGFSSCVGAQVMVSVNPVTADTRVEAPAVANTLIGSGVQLVILATNGTPIPQPAHTLLFPIVSAEGVVRFQRRLGGGTIETLYVSRSGTPGTGVLSSNFPGASTFPMHLELDGRKYAIFANGQAQTSLSEGGGDYTIAAGGFSNCRRSNGAPLSAFSPPFLRFGSFVTELSVTTTIRYDWLASNDIVIVQSRTGDVVCNGQLP